MLSRSKINLLFVSVAVVILCIIACGKNYEYDLKKSILSYSNLLRLYELGDGVMFVEIDKSSELSENTQNLRYVLVRRGEGIGWRVGEKVGKLVEKGAIVVEVPLKGAVFNGGVVSSLACMLGGEECVWGIVGAEDVAVGAPVEEWIRREGGGGEERRGGLTFEGFVATGAEALFSDYPEGGVERRIEAAGRRRGRGIKRGRAVSRGGAVSKEERSREERGEGGAGWLVVPCLDWLETSPLGRAEWMRFYGRLLGRGERADSLFAVVERGYLEAVTDAARRVRAAGGRRPWVLAGLPSGGFRGGRPSGDWWVPGGGSYRARLIEDAGGAYLLKGAPSVGGRVGSVRVGGEWLAARVAGMSKNGGETVWLLEGAGAESVGDAGLPFWLAGARRIVIRTAGRPYFEVGPWRPDWVVRGLSGALFPGAASVGEGGLSGVFSLQI